MGYRKYLRNPLYVAWRNGRRVRIMAIASVRRRECKQEAGEVSGDRPQRPKGAPQLVRARRGCLTLTAERGRCDDRRGLLGAAPCGPVVSL